MLNIRKEETGETIMRKTILFFIISLLLINSASAYTFTNIGGDFKIEYPAGWTYLEEPDGSDQTFTSQTGRASVRVVVEYSGGISLDEGVSDRIKFLQNNYGISPFSEKYVTVGGVKGKELMFYYYTEQKEYKYRQILIVSGDKSYIISVYSLTSDFPFFSEDFEKIINSFALLKPVITPKVTAGYTPAPTPVGYTPVPAPTPVQTETGAPTIALRSELTSILVGEEVQLILSIVAPLGKPKMGFQIILIPPSGMSVTSQEFSQTGAGQYSQKGTIVVGEERPVVIKLKANEAGDKNVEATVRYYFGDDESNITEVSKSQKIKVSAEAAPTVTRGGEPSGGGSAVVVIIVIAAIIFAAYMFINRRIRAAESKISGVEEQTREVQAQQAGFEEERETVAEPVEEPKREVKAAKKKESAFEIERRKQHRELPPEDVDLDTRNYLNLGVSAALSTLDAEIARAESDAMQVQGEIKKTEGVLGKLGTRLVNKEISEQTYNDLKTKYSRKVSEMKSRIASYESEAARKQKIRSFVEEKGKYYT